jgi:hypothetical protein
MVKVPGKEGDTVSRQEGRLVETDGDWERLVKTPGRD